MLSRGGIAKEVAAAAGFVVLLMKLKIFPS
jgi:hypothetical protein